MRPICCVPIAVPLLSMLLWPATPFDDRRQRDLDATPSDLRFRLSTPKGQTAFRAGERIPVTLEFSSRSPGKYQLADFTYGVPGRGSEEFVLDRNDGTDPYRDYLGTQLQNLIPFCTFFVQAIGPEPYSFELNLNEWFRLDRPGRYRLYVQTHRLERQRRPAEAGFSGSTRIPATSNAIEIEILPRDRAWERAKLAQIRTSSTAAKKSSDQETDQTASLAEAELRYLATEEAVQLMFERARRGFDLDPWGLTGARNRKAMLEEFDRYLADPKVAFDHRDLFFRALFSFIKTGSPQLSPWRPWQSDSVLEQDQEAQRKRFQPFEIEEARRLAHVLPGKELAARHACAAALRSRIPELVPDYDEGLTREELVAQFEQFTPEQQRELLTRKWEQIEGPEMNPVLRRVLERIPRELPVYDSWEIGHYALRRLYEMDASSVATILQKAFLAGNGRFAEFARREFPASELPGADEAISRLLDAGASTGMRLAAKFASPRLAGRLSALSQNDGNCTKRTALAAYLARTAPAEGLELVQGFLQEPGGGCFRWVLEEAARASWTPAMEQLAMTALGSANPDIEGAAAAALSAHGSESAEGLLWAALERWSAKRKDRAAGVAPRATGIVAYDDETRLGEALFRSLADARGWVFDEPHRKRAQALCAAGSCGPYSLLGQRRPAPIQILPRIGQGDSWVDFEVEGYCAPSLEDLETKLSHYPAGTVFSWWPDQGGDHPFFTGREQKKIFDELSGFLAAHGMTISERQP